MAIAVKAAPTALSSVSSFQVNTIAGTGLAMDSGDGSPAVGSSLYNPEAIASHPTVNHLFISTNTKIRKIDAYSSEISTIAGTGEPGISGDNGPATSATFLNKYGLFVDLGNHLLMAIWQGNVVRSVDLSSGIVVHIAGSGNAPSFHANGDGHHATSAHFASPTDLWANTAGDLFLSDFVSNNVRMVNGTTNLVSTIAGSINTIAG
jgi:hypothetical protein